MARKLLNFPDVGKSRPEVKIDVCSFPVEEHVIFYEASSTGIVVIAILHANSDIDAFARLMNDQIE